MNRFWGRLKFRFWSTWIHFLPWSHTFWHTRIGKRLAPLFRKPLICGQTCGCSKVTGCLGESLGKSEATFERRQTYYL